MYGVPQVLATAADFEKVHQMALNGECDPEAVGRHWRGLLASRQAYDRDRVLADGESADGPEPKYKVLEEELEDGTTQRVQYVLAEQPGAKIYALGYTVAGVESKLTELGV